MCCIHTVSCHTKQKAYERGVECSLTVLETRVQSQVKSYHRLKKWYLMLPCLPLCIIGNGSWVKWSNPRNGDAPSSIPRLLTLWIYHVSFMWQKYLGKLDIMHKFKKLMKKETQGHHKVRNPCINTFFFIKVLLYWKKAMLKALNINLDYFVNP